MMVAAWLMPVCVLFCSLQKGYAQQIDAARSAFGSGGIYLGMGVHELTTIIKTTSWRHQFPLLTGKGDSNGAVTLRTDLGFAPEEDLPSLSRDSNSIATLACGYLAGRRYCANIAWVSFVFQDSLVSQMYFTSDELKSVESVTRYGRLALQSLVLKLGEPTIIHVKGVLPSWKRLRQLKRPQEFDLATWRNGDDIAILGIYRHYHGRYSYFIRMTRLPN